MVAPSSMGKEGSKATDAAGMEAPSSVPADEQQHQEKHALLSKSAKENPVPKAAEALGGGENRRRRPWCLIGLVTVCGIILAGMAFTFLLTYCSISAKTNVSPNPWGLARPLRNLQSPVVLLISFDGFRWGYNWKVPTPNIDRLRLNGTEAEPGMIPVYPTLTFPNHYSIVTGLYPAWHGIIANSFTDPSTKDKFYQGNIDPKWWLGEPLWETVVKHGLHAATLFWPGSDVSKGSWNCSPCYCRPYNGSLPFEDRVDSVLHYFDLPPAERPSFITLYFEEPDHTGHQKGPDDPDINKAVSRMDRILGRLLDGLEERGVFEDTTIILVGDHGMVNTCDQKLIYLEDFAHWIDIPADWLDSTSPVLAIRPPPTVNATDVCTKFSAALNSDKVKNGDFLKVYLKEDLPARLHYSASNRIQPIIGIVDEGYKLEKKQSKGKECGGAHGYDNEHLSMRTIFIGHGPQFGKGRKIPSFINVELYNLITSIIGISAAPNNGSSDFASTILLSSHE